jgi:polyribonucleotide nucleotidyltransferase
VIQAIIKLAELAAKDPRDFVAPPDYRPSKPKCSRLAEADLRAAYKITEKEDRYDCGRRRQEVGQGSLCRQGRSRRSFRTPKTSAKSIHNLQAKIVRWNVLDTGLRIDGRDLKTVRPIVSEVGVLPRTHGSACSPAAKPRRWSLPRWAPARTSSISTALEGTQKQNFLLHYNFPPYSVGEAGRMGSPGAAKSAMASWPGAPSTRSALDRRIPLHDPRRVRDHRIQRFVLDGNRLRHLAGTDGCRRAAGASVAGIAMGLILEGEKFAVLSDILGDEDHLGDMDFKVAGTEAA